MKTNMVEKVEVRGMLASYEAKIKEEIKEVENKMKVMRDNCTTPDMVAILRESVPYNKLNQRWITLNCVRREISDMRCSELLDDCRL